jgi:hypothetical protein
MFDRGIIKELPWSQYLTAQPDFVDNEDKKKDSNLDGNSRRESSEKEQRDLGYVQNQEQGKETIWQRIKKGNE